jgi:hypothetical protein
MVVWKILVHVFFGEEDGVEFSYSSSFFLEKILLECGE